MTPDGACQACAGIGSHVTVDPERALGDRELGVGDGILLPWAQLGRAGRVYFERLLEALARDVGFSLTTPWQDLDDDIRKVVLHGTGSDLTVAYRTRFGRDRTYATRYEGLAPWLQRKYAEAESDTQRAKYTKFLREAPCAACHGRRLAPEVLAVTVGGRSIAEVSAMDLASATAFLRTLELPVGDAAIVESLLPELLGRLQFLLDTGLDYLTLSRAAGTLSGVEAQRIRLATQIGAGLSGVIYVLDEPSIGLHQRDNARLISTLESLRDLGNTVLVVEHDEETIRSADWVVDVGPGAGVAGGQVVHSGTVADLLSARNSITSDYLCGRRSISTPTQRRPFDRSRILRIEGARENNLRNVTVDLPLGLFTAVTGVSGSGKSTLVNDILYNSVANTLNGAQRSPGRHTRIRGMEHLDKVVHVDQSPIGRSPRSNPATYTGVFDKIRTLFAQTTNAKVRGYTPARFSFNVKGGRCEDCLGEGTSTVEMNFLPDVHVECKTCRGRRFNRDTLDIRFKGRSIADVLEMRIAEAAQFFESHGIISRYLTTLDRVGLGYLALGQSALTLSGGEAQRVKLATELQRRTRGQSLYILDEPTTGLHFEDVYRVLELLQALVEKGNTVVVIEHNLDVIRCADWVIDLGPEGGRRGGTVIGCGTPEDLASVEDSQTGKYLRPALTGRPG
ncbi:excinuclease ABC subunit UvrA [Rhodococcus sp. LB1]|uniref:excinuclease ABC subunit UvrA n=1 Tax=Rhodococcus sp. LB1 TaxID=1807499 RepID=UPI003FA68887